VNRKRDEVFSVGLLVVGLLELCCEVNRVCLRVLIQGL
jgi:hypothetical protein